jgi:hypothetical protein
MHDGVEGLRGGKLVLGDAMHVFMCEWIIPLEPIPTPFILNSYNMCECIICCNQK